MNSNAALGGEMLEINSAEEVELADVVESVELDDGRIVCENCAEEMEE